MPQGHARPRDCIIAVSWLYCDCIVAVSWLYRGCIIAVSWLYCGCIVAVSWLYCGCIVTVSWLYRGYMVTYVVSTGCGVTGKVAGWEHRSGGHPSTGLGSVCNRATRMPLHWVRQHRGTSAEMQLSQETPMLCCGRCWRTRPHLARIGPPSSGPR